MDAETRERYEEWKKRRIIQRLVMPGVGLFLMLILGILLLRACSGGDEVIENSSHSVVVRPPALSANYRDFDFTVYETDAIVLLSEEIDQESFIVLVNKVFRLPEDYSPSDLVVPAVLSVGGVNNSDHFLRTEAAVALESMFAAALSEDELTLWLSSGYRSHETQMMTHQHFVDLVGREEGEMISARPGHCEHQTGLAASVTAPSVGGYLIRGFSETVEGAWLRENAHRFGFIIRYPEGRELVTGFLYEPWSLRYVGIPVAAYVFENDLVLEQYVLPYVLSQP